MEDNEIIHLWKTYDMKLEESLSLNRELAADLTRLKVQTFMSSMKPLKLFTILVGMVWVVLVDTLIISLFHVAGAFFLVSAGIQVLLTQLAIGIYLYQLVLIHRVDISEPVLATQEKLARLQSSTLWVARLLFLQLPVWTTFYLNKGMLENGNMWWCVLQVLVTAAFTYAAIWLFVNIRYENREKKWFRFIFAGKEWTPIMKSMELLGEVKSYQ
ncbi:hypothetical protein [Chitinophaga arvensicola]|uniref:Uncharacterized protein n=1 Tax=Chitinophaga arvensicola TaxID=29529 RepID=A0A1I0RGQ3_9BACT|nr:hypothetical protein [Chitinophaga arvensicola]SEW39861.1 hypothetical protein SAMN04488122_2792 [Chitinophaga arvensicola]